MNYDEALNFIINKQSLGIMPGLARIKTLLSDYGNPQDKMKIIHIAGTNGKGTVANSIANSLADAGYKVGLFTSPWITDYREQIQINGVPISKESFSAITESFTLADNGCSEFELVTAMAYIYFEEQKVDYAVMECGMGGLEDATNVEKKNISVITSVAIDHTNFLGNTIEEIAQQKAGIIKKKSTCILYPNPVCAHIFEKVCNSKNTKLIKVEQSDDYRLNNYNTVVQTLRAIDVECPDVQLAQLMARQQKIGNVLVDGGHNVDAAQALAPVINNEIALIGMMKDKNIDGYLSLVAPKCKKIIVTAANNARSMPPAELANIAKKYCTDVCAIDNPVDALSFAKANGLTLICGSFYLVREIIDYI